MPNETYFDKAEKQEPCRCKNPNSNGAVCLNCGGSVELVEAPEFGLWKGSEIYRHKYESKPLIDGIMNHRDFVLIQAEGGVGKTTLAQQIKFNLTTGEPFLGQFHVHGKNNVLWCMGESTKGKHIKRLMHMKRAVKVDDDRWWFFNCSKVHLNTDIGFKAFCDAIANLEVKFDVIFFDSLYCFFRGSFSDDDATMAWTENVRKLAGEYSATVVCLHHTPKDSFANDGAKIDKGHRPIGSTFWDAFFTTSFKLVKRNTGMYYLVSGKDRDGDTCGDIPMHMVKPQHDRQKRYFFTQEVDSLVNKGKINEMKLLGLFKEKPERYADELFYGKNEKKEHDPRVSRSSFFSLAKKLRDNGTLDCWTDESGATVYKYVGVVCNEN